MLFEGPQGTVIYSFWSRTRGFRRLYKHLAALVGLQLAITEGRHSSHVNDSWHLNVGERLTRAQKAPRHMSVSLRPLKVSMAVTYLDADARGGQL